MSNTNLWRSSSEGEHFNQLQYVGDDRDLGEGRDLGDYSEVGDLCDNSRRSSIFLMTRFEAIRTSGANQIL